VRDKSGSNDLVFRSGNWEPNSTHQDNNNNNIKQKEEEEETHHTDLPAKEKLPEEKARQYQLDVLEQAKNRNTIAFLETGAGKTLIAVLLIKSIHHTLHHQNKKMLAVFLVPKVPLVYQVIYPLSHNLLFISLTFNAMQCN
jgi:endoribonuclease Dicer